MQFKMIKIMFLHRLDELAKDTFMYTCSIQTPIVNVKWSNIFLKQTLIVLT